MREAFSDRDLSRLGTMVLLQAVQDFINPPWADKRHKNSLKREAELFFFGGGEWRKKRQFWCYCAGIDPDSIGLKVKLLMARGGLKKNSNQRIANGRRKVFGSVRP
ncbi:hypothetical protein FACS1894186_5730 [Alphaproteobacteria bacterium]|nr:hypothetical protein FACS1894186_5730 [Alphaproteobacteria bacterium]